MTVLLAIIAGGGLGFVLARGDFCFHSTWRRFFGDPAEKSLVRAYAVLLLMSTPIVQILIATGVIDPFIPGFAPPAATVGGLLFGVGMVIAKTCISGMFYKLGAGMLAMVVAIVAWSVGDIVTWRGPLLGLRERLNENPITSTSDGGSEQAATVTSWLGPFGLVLVVLAALALAVWVARDEAVSVVSHDAPHRSGTEAHRYSFGPCDRHRHERCVAACALAWLRLLLRHVERAESNMESA